MYHSNLVAFELNVELFVLLWGKFSEAFRTPIFRSGPDKNGFNLGRVNNFQEVFGDDQRLWLLPVFTR